MVDLPFANKNFHFACFATPLQYLQYLIMVFTKYISNNNYIQDIKYPILVQYVNIMY